MLRQKSKRAMVFIIMFTMIFTSISFTKPQTVNAATVGTWKTNSKNAGNSHVSGPTPLFTVKTADAKDAVGTKGVCSQAGKYLSLSGKISKMTEMAGKVRNGTASAKQKKYVYVAYRAYQKNVVTASSPNYKTILKYSRVMNYIRTGSYSSSGQINAGYSKADFDEVISLGKSAWTKAVQNGTAAGFRCYYNTNAASNEQNFITWKMIPSKGTLSLIKDSTEGEFSESILTEEYTYSGIKYQVYKEDKTTPYGDPLVCNADGNTNEITNVPNGKYYAKEIQSNSYFALDYNWIGPVTISDSNKIGIFNAADDPVWSLFRVQKQLDPSGSTNKSLAGFNFTLTYNPPAGSYSDEAEGSGDRDSSDDTGSGDDDDESGDYAYNEDHPLIFYGTTDGNGQINTWRIQSPVSRYGEVVSYIPAGSYTLNERTNTSQFTDEGCESVTSPNRTVYLSPNEWSYNTYTWTNKFPVELQMQIQKKTTDFGSAEGFKFKVTGPSFPDGKIVFTDNRINDFTYSSDIIEADDAGNPLLEGTYTVEEVLTPEQLKRYKQPASKTTTLTIGGNEDVTFEFENVARTWDVKMKKDATDGNVDGIDFKVTGETIYGRSITKNVQSDANGDILIDGMQPGEYVIEETGFDAEKYINVKKVDGFDKPAIKFTITGNEPEGQVIDLTSNDSYVFENIKIPTITTSFVGMSGKHIADPTDKTPLKDIVNYTGLKPGAEYTLKCTRNDKATGLKEGEEVTKTFTPEASSGSVDVEFEIDALSLQNKTEVAFEELYYKGVKIAEECQIHNLDQTLYFPYITTEAFTESLYDIKNARFGDKISYSNLAPGEEYEVKTTVYDKDEDKFLPIESVKTLKIDPLSENSPEATITSSDDATANATADASSESMPLGSASDNGTYGFDGEMTVDFMGDLSEAEGHDIVLFVEFSIDGQVVASHTDPDDEKETIHVPSGTVFTPLSLSDPIITGDENLIILFVWIICFAGASLYLVRKYLR